MFRCLCPGAIGISLPYPEAVRLAKASGYEGIDVYVGAELAPQKVKQLLEESGLRAGGCGLPVDFRTPEEAKFKSDLSRLKEAARAAAQAGCSRFVTWILPFSDTLPFRENFQFHAQRLSACAAVLAEFGARLGLEFIGPRTLLRRHRFEFIRTLDGMMELCRAVGDNAGLLLDAWHWYTSQGTARDIEKLRNKDVVYVHINATPAGVAMDEQIDNVHKLPGETGVINLVAFLQALKVIGYDGPVVPEPFVKKLQEMKPEEAARLVLEHLNRVWKKAGVGGGKNKNNSPTAENAEGAGRQFC